MKPPHGPVNIAEVFTRFSDHWSPKIIGRVNDLDLKAVKIEGEFLWHVHEDTDEFFLVHTGEVTIEFEDRDDVALRSGEFCIVPRGVRHRPVAASECELLLLEPVGTVNTGDADASDLTAEDEWV